MAGRLGRVLNWLGVGVLVLFCVGALMAYRAGNPEFAVLVLVAGIAAFLIGLASKYVLSGE